MTFAQGPLTTLANPISIQTTDGRLIVGIDIRPGTFPNVVNLKSAGTIPVAILSGPGFDARTIDPATISLNGARVKLVGKGERALCAAEDVNSDGRLDLVCHIVVDSIQPGESIAVLEASTSISPRST